jgi:hypothetical protein
MIVLILVLLILFLFFGYGPLRILDVALFNINGKIITLWDLLIFLVVPWAVGILPSPIREIIGIVLLIWILSTLGLFAVAGLSQILLIVIIIAVVFALF